MADQRANRDEEIRKILELVAAGEITPEGAATLMDALEARPAPSEGDGSRRQPANGHRVFRVAGPAAPNRPRPPARPHPPALPHRVTVRSTEHGADAHGVGRDLSRELRRLSREARRISHEAQKVAKRDMKEAIREAKGEIKHAFRLSVNEARKAATEVEAELRRVFTDGSGEGADFSWLANLAGLDITRDRVKHVAQVLLQEDAGPGDRVSIRNAGGDIVVRGWDEARVEVRGDKVGWGMDKEMAQDRAESMPLEIQRRDGEILVEARPPVASGMGLFNLQRMKSDITVMVPRGMQLSANARGGDIIIEESAGDLSVNTTGGDVVITGASGNVDAETVKGDLTLREAKAKNLALTSLSGDITIYLSPQPGGDYRLRSARGDVHAHVAPDQDVECDLETVSGDLNVGGPFSIVSRERGRIRCAMTGPAAADREDKPLSRLKIVTISGDASVS